MGDIVVRFKQTMIGVAWAQIRPDLTVFPKNGT
jgi:ABC-type polysaccharide/polyol phosphate export permease